MAKIGTQHLNILGQSVRVNVYYNGRESRFSVRAPTQQFPDFMLVSGAIDDGNHKGEIVGETEEQARTRMMKYARQYNELVPNKRHVIIIRHEDTRDVGHHYGNREASPHGFEIEWVEAYMAGNAIFDKGDNSMSAYVTLDNEAIIDYTPERAEFLKDLTKSLDAMSDSVRKFIKLSPGKIEKLIDTNTQLLLP